MWIELGIFILVLIFAIHQIRDVRKEQRKRAEREQAEKDETKWVLWFKNMNDESVLEFTKQLLKLMLKMYSAR